MAPAALHPSPETLQAFALGRLPAKEAAEIERHLSDCEACGAVLAQVGDDTLAQLAKAAATKTMFAPTAEAGVVTVPTELADHPRYRIVGVLGRGGMGTVFRAEHRLMERQVALKVINRQLTADTKAVERFRREVKAAARLVHPNIVTAYDAEQAGDLHFLVMEYIDGWSLDRLIAKQGPPTPQQCCRLMQQAALGLHQAHEKGMVHRDIKPQNLMVTRKGQLKILDFGLSRLAEAAADIAGDTSAPADSFRTAAGIVLGTPDYIAPEQVTDAASADIRADIYSLGCTFYFLLTGRPPFAHGSVFEKLKSHCETPPDSVHSLRGDVPAEMAGILDKMMAKAPADRFQTPAELAKALAAAGKSVPENFVPPMKLDGPPSLVAAPLPVRPVQPFSAAETVKRFRVPLIAAAVLLLIGGIGWRMFLGGGDLPPKKQIAATNVPPVPPPVGATKKILFVIPQFGVWYADYGPVKERLEQAGYQVLTASIRPGECRTLDDDKRSVPSSVRAEVAVANAADLPQKWDAVLFAGFDVTPFITPGPSYDAVGKLITAARSQNKPIGGICVGQSVLAHHQLLDGRQAAGGKLIHGPKVRYDRPGGPDWIDQPVVVADNGRIITGRDDAAAIQFTNAVLKSLQAK